jgi:hypothetical protein
MCWSAICFENFLDTGPRELDAAWFYIQHVTPKLRATYVVLIHFFDVHHPDYLSLPVDQDTKGLLPSMPKTSTQNAVLSP